MWLIYGRFVIFAFIQYAVSQMCPPQMVMQLVQEQPVDRPEGILNLTCNVTGVTLSDLDAYWWMLVDTNEPIVTYFEKQREINSNFGTMFVDESLSHSPNHVQSNLQLRVNITNRQTYGCEIQTKDNKFCDKDTKINFKAPKIVLGVPQGTIYLPRNKRDKHSNVSCSVENTDGKPNITMLYTTVKDVEIRVEGIVEAENNHSSYFNSSQKAKLLALDSGHLTCHVADKIGIYIAKKFMAVTAEGTLPKQDESTEWMIIVFPLIAALVFGAVTIAFIVYVMKRRLKKSRNQRRNYDEQRIFSTIDETAPFKKKDDDVVSFSNPEQLEMPGLKKTDIVLDLIWAYGNLKSDAICRQLCAALQELRFTAHREQRRDQLELKPTKTGEKYFIVLLWDQAATESKAFHTLALQAQLEAEDDAVTCINVQVGNINQNTTYQESNYIFWCNTAGENDINVLAREIIALTQKENSFKGIENIVEGLVWSYFAVYLKTVLSYIKEKKYIFGEWRRENNADNLLEEFVIIIPDSGNVQHLSDLCDKGCYKPAGNLCSITIDDSGTKGRTFQPRVHMVKSNKGSEQKYHFVGEFANPVHTLHILEEQNIILDNMTLINNFERRLRFILDHESYGFHGCYRIVRFDDETTDFKKLNKILISELKKGKNEVVKSQFHSGKGQNFFMLHDCIEQCSSPGDCSLQQVTSVMENEIETSIKPITTFDFTRKGVRHFFENLQGNDKLCFLWNKACKKSQNMRICFNLAMQVDNSGSRLLHIELEKEAFPGRVQAQNLVQCHLKGDKHSWGQNLRASLRDYFLRQEDLSLCGLVGVGLAISFFYSYISLKMPLWDDCLDQKRTYFGNLHERLIIIIPKSGRSLSSEIPGCQAIDQDKSKLSAYVKLRGDLTTLEENEKEEYRKLPTMVIYNEDVGRPFITTIYKLPDKKMTYHAAIEYATPVRTLYVMYNEQHMASQPAFSSFTTKWLVGEIELLHKKLQSLVKKATFHIKENVDIVYFDDMTWRESSEQKYRIKASESLKEKLLQKIKERPPEKNTMFDR